MFNYHNKVFVCTDNKNIRDVSSETAFYFKQNGNIVRATYSGGTIIYGEIIGMVNDQGILQAAFNYQNAHSQFHGGTCTLQLIDTDNKLHGLWKIAEENAVENEIILEELRDK